MSNVITQLPQGTSISQVVLTPTTTAQSHTLTNPAQGVRLVATGLNPAITAAPAFIYVCFDAPNDAARDTWLTDSVVAPRIAIPVNGVGIELNFDGAAVNTLSYKLSAADATARLHVETIA